MRLGMHAGKRLGWPSESRLYGLQANDVSRDLLEIYQSPPVTSQIVFHISMKPKPPNWDSPVKGN